MTKQEKIREAMQHLWCQHCKALQKANYTGVECWYNPLAEEGAFAFCAANEDAISEILRKQVSQGVVIKVDRELLPHEEVTWNKIALMQQSYRATAQEYHHKGQDEMLKAGYVATEPLIESKV